MTRLQCSSVTDEEVEARGQGMTGPNLSAARKDQTTQRFCCSLLSVYKRTQNLKPQSHEENPPACLTIQNNQFSTHTTPKVSAPDRWRQVLGKIPNLGLKDLEAAVGRARQTHVSFRKIPKSCIRRLREHRSGMGWRLVT